MKKLCFTIEDFFQLKGAVLYDAEKIKPIIKVSIDSRNVPPGSLFIAIKGDKFDGHDFITDAVKKGASVVLINEKKLSALDEIDVPIITVRDTTAALGELAAVWRKKLRTKIIGITGSAGKTTTKEMIFTLLSAKYKVNKTSANNNNHIGVPLTLFSTTNRYDYLVLELGTNHFGEIKYTADIAQPNLALITNIGDSHLEFLKDRKGVLQEKSALFDSAIKNKGTIFINNDDTLLVATRKKYKKRITFGLEKNADVKGEFKKFTNMGNPVVQIAYKRKRFSYSIPLYGEQSVRNFIASAAIAFNAGLNDDDIKKSIKKIRAVEKRLNVDKIGDFILINDTYNANPDSTRLALQLLGQINHYANRIAILGDMFELGKNSKMLHEKLSTEIVKNKINSVYTIGGMMKYLHTKLKASKINAVHFTTRDSLNSFLKERSFSKSTVLVKGSRGMRMEEFVATIKSVGK